MRGSSGLCRALRAVGRTWEGYGQCAHAPSSGCFGEDSLWGLRAGGQGQGQGQKRRHCSRWVMMELDQVEKEEGGEVVRFGVEFEGRLSVSLIFIGALKERLRPI